MSTIGTIATWACSMTNRPDRIGVAADFAVDVYRMICGKVPFDQLSKKTAEIPTVVGQQEYSLVIPAPRLAGIISIRMTYNSTSRRRLGRSHVRVYDAYSNIPSGRPATYARFGNDIELMPIPDSASYTFRVRYWEFPDVNTNPDELGATLVVTPVDWDELLKWETLFRFYTFLEQHDKANMLIQPMPLPRQPSPQKTRTFEIGIIPRLWNDLLKTVSQREHCDEDFGINPMMRPYTHG